MTCWDEVFNNDNGILTITGSCDELGPLENHKEDALIINIEGNFKILADFCFKGYQQLTQINLPDSIIEIKDNIIQDTLKLDSLTLPCNVKTLSN